MNSNNTETTTTNEIYREFLPIDGRNTGLPIFVISMLRIGQILTAKEAVKREVTATRISALMDRHRNEIPSTYTAWEIREQLSRYGGELKGGGVKIEWQEWPGKNYRLIPHYHFSFSRLYKPEDYVVKTEANHEPARTENK